MKEMTALEYFKERNRMSENCTIDCEDCPFDQHRNGRNVDCCVLEADFPEDAVFIVQKWAEEHTRKTILQDLLEKYPNANVAYNGVPNFCPNILGYFESEDCCGMKCKDCWNRPLEEEK